MITSKNCLKRYYVTNFYAQVFEKHHSEEDKHSSLLVFQEISKSKKIISNY